MIQIFTGLPRSGKTYRAVKFIYDEFVNHKGKDYAKFEYLYTNIGGFKFEPINEILLSHPVSKTDDDAFIKTVNPLKFDDIYKHLTKAYEMAEDDKEDEELVKYLSYHKLTPALFVVDECYRYFSKRSDPVLVWWLAYHAHLGMDIILILQNKALMHSDYKSFTEFFIDAQPKSKSLSSKQLRYHHYASDSYTKDQKFSSDSLVGKKEIFDLYKSGDIHKPKQIIYKFIFIFLFAVVAMIFSISLLFNTPPASESNSSQFTETSTEYITNISTNPFKNIDLEFLTLRCNNKYCWNVDTNFERKSITMTYFKYIVIKYELELQFEEISAEIYSLKPFKKTMSKKTLSKLTDYYYMIPRDLKTTYLKDLFIPRVKERERLTAPSPFGNTTGNKEGETQKQATSA